MKKYECGICKVTSEIDYYTEEFGYTCKICTLKINRIVESHLNEKSENIIKSGKKKIKFEWEEINDHGVSYTQTCALTTWRAKVFGGWLVRYEALMNYRYENLEDSDFIEDEGYQKHRDSMIFLPDPNHEWEICDD